MMTSVSESLVQDSQDTFLKLIEKVQTEIQERFAMAHQILKSRESELLSELQRLSEVYACEGIEDEIREIDVSKEDLSAVKGDTASIDTRIKELKENLQIVPTRYKSVRLEWDESLERSLGKIGKVSLNYTNRKIPNYRNLTQPVAAFGKHSQTDRSTGVFLYPRCVAIDSVTTTFTFVMDTIVFRYLMNLLIFYSRSVSKCRDQKVSVS